MKGYFVESWLKKTQKVCYVRKIILLKYGFQVLNKAFITFHMGRDCLDYTILLQLFNFELARIPGLGTMCNFCYSFNEVKLQYSKSQGQWIGMWALVFTNPNKYILAILAKMKWHFLLQLWTLELPQHSKGKMCLAPNKPVSSLHKFIDLQALMETEVQKQTSKLLMWRNKNTDIEAIPFLTLSFGY